MFYVNDVYYLLMYMLEIYIVNLIMICKYALFLYTFLTGVTELELILSN